MRADSLYYLREKLRFTNPFFDEVAGDYFYSFVLVCWEAEPAATAPTLQPLNLPRVRESDAAASGDESASDGAQLLRLRRCRACGKYRMLPRHQGEPREFVCASLEDARFASCERRRAPFGCYTICIRLKLP